MKIENTHPLNELGVADAFVTTDAPATTDVPVTTDAPVTTDVHNESDAFIQSISTPVESDTLHTHETFVTPVESDQLIDDEIRKCFKAELEDVTFSDEAKDRMACAIDERVNAQKQREGVITMRTSHPVKATRRPAFKFAIAACIAATLCVGTVAYATGSLVSVQEAIDTIFNGTPAQTEIVDKIGKPIGAAVSQNGVTVSADAVIADGHNYAIVYSIRKDDGSAFPAMTANEYGYLPIVCRDQTTDIIGLHEMRSGGAHGGYGASYFYDADPKDNSIQMVEQMSVESGDNTLNGRTAHAYFGDFLLVGDSYDDPVVLASGDWKLNFKINSEDTTINIPANKEFRAPAGMATMNELTVSAIAIGVKYVFSSDLDIEYDAQAISGTLLAGDIDLNMDDGTSMTVKNLGGMSMVEQADGSVVCSQNLFLPQIIDPENVKSVIVGGTEFEF